MIDWGKHINPFSPRYFLGISSSPFFGWLYLWTVPDAGGEDTTQETTCPGHVNTRVHTSNSLIATQLLRGKPCSMGTKNWRHPDQWPTSSIMQIKLKMRMKTLAMLRNWKVTRISDDWRNLPSVHWWKPNNLWESLEASALRIADILTSVRWVASYK